MLACFRRTALAAGTGAILLASAALAPAATAAERAHADAKADDGTCAVAPISQPFAAWRDQSSYVLAPGGDFETPAWTLDHGAALVPGSEPFAATGTLGSDSLSLPAQASAQSPETCVDGSDPSLRFFIAGTGKVMVRVLYGGAAISVGEVPAGGNWAPSAALPTLSAVFGSVWGSRVAIRFTALTGKPQIDDVFIDPWNRH
jgi:hypothetical protein